MSNQRKVSLDNLMGRDAPCESFPSSKDLDTIDGKQGTTKSDAAKDDSQPASSTPPLPPPPTPPPLTPSAPKVPPPPLPLSPQISCTVKLRKGIDKHRSFEDAQIWCRCNAKGDKMADKDNCHNLGGGKGAFCRWDPETKFCIPRDVPEEISKDTSPEENITPTDVEEDPKEEETTISPSASEKHEPTEEEEVEEKETKSPTPSGSLEESGSNIPGMSGVSNNCLPPKGLCVPKTSINSQFLIGKPKCGGVGEVESEDSSDIDKDQAEENDGKKGIDIDSKKDQTNDEDSSVDIAKDDSASASTKGTPTTCPCVHNCHSEGWCYVSCIGMKAEDTKWPEGVSETYLDGHGSSQCTNAELESDTVVYTKASMFSFSLGRWHRKCEAKETQAISDTLSIQGEYNICEGLFSRAVNSVKKTLGIKSSNLLQTKDVASYVFRLQQVA
jgi:hypothetical protein